MANEGNAHKAIKSEANEEEQIMITTKTWQTKGKIITEMKDGQQRLNRYYEKLSIELKETDDKIIQLENELTAKEIVKAGKSTDDIQTSPIGWKAISRSGLATRTRQPVTNRPA